jgi:uncharacterized protein YbjQ (UPF0145 family)
MRGAISVVLIAALVLVYSGCTGYGQYMVSNSTYTATRANDICVYTVSKPAVKFETLGYLSVYTSDARDAGDALKDRLRVKAALLGADAIVAFKFNQESTGGGGVEGIAIKFTK